MKKLLSLFAISALFLSACVTTSVNLGDDREYFSENEEACEKIEFTCAEGTEVFSDLTGCGCEDIDEEESNIMLYGDEAEEPADEVDEELIDELSDEEVGEEVEEGAEEEVVEEEIEEEVEVVEEELVEVGEEEELVNEEEIVEEEVIEEELTEEESTEDGGQE